MSNTTATYPAGGQIDVPIQSLVPGRTKVEIVIPVYNEQAALPLCIERLVGFLQSELPYDWSIVIANNASTDATEFIAKGLCEQYPNVKLLSLTEKGRGRALRAAWTASAADVLCYMDVDLSTDLKALPPLIAPLASGHSDVAIGSRLASGSRVVRGPKREFISRTYNQILRLSLRSRFSDAQCGFKAIRGDVAQQLLPQIENQEWFFDTEMLVLAERAGMRIHEVPVDWVDDPDSRVDIVATALEDLRGIARLLAATRVASFMMIGVFSTLAYVAIYMALRGSLGAFGANAAALAITAVANTQANRRLTFGISGSENLIKHQLMGGVVFVLTLLLTNGALAILHAVNPKVSHPVELAVLIAASICATITRYIGLKTWVFAQSHNWVTQPKNELAPNQKS